MTRFRTGGHSPFNIWVESSDEPDVQWAMARTDHMASELVRLANLGATLEQASAVVWSLFDDWQRTLTDITCEMGYDPPDEEIENRRQALIALFDARSGGSVDGGE